MLKLKKIRGVEFDEFTHSYICGDKVLDGVTTLMKKHGLSPDYSSIPADILERAAAHGTAVHELLQAYDDGKVVVEDEEGNLKAYKALGLPIAASEYLVSDKKLVASFIDKVFEDGSLGDVKTTSVLHERSVSWQLSIYAWLFEKQNPEIHVPHIYAIHVRKGVAKLVELARIPDEQVAALFKAEEEGRIYEDVKPLADESLGLREVDIANYVDALEVIAQLKSALKEYEDKISEVQDRMYNYMVENHVPELKCASGLFTLKNEYTRTSIDSARLKKAMPDVYDQFLKTTTVKGSVIYKSNN